MQRKTRKIRNHAMIQTSISKRHDAPQSGQKFLLLNDDLEVPAGMIEQYNNTNSQPNTTALNFRKGSLIND